MLSGVSEEFMRLEACWKSAGCGVREVLLFLFYSVGVFLQSFYFTIIEGSL